MKILRTTLVLLAGLMFSLNACANLMATSEYPEVSSETPTGPITITVHAPPPTIPSSPLRIHLTFSTLPILNKPLYLSCFVSSTDDAPNSVVQIRLPEGVSHISSDIEWRGDLKRNYGRYFSAQIVFNESGNQTIEATASRIIDENNSWYAVDTITLDFGPNGVPISTLPDSTLPDRRINRYAVIETFLEISPTTPKLNEPNTLSVTITSPVDVPRIDTHGLKATVIFSREGYELLDGNNIVPVTIKAGEMIHFSVVVVFKKTGSWSVRASVCELITPGDSPAGMYHYSPENTIFFNIID